MSGIFNTLNTATKGLLAQQTSLHTTGHNIANANTEGYSRQRVDLQADIAYHFEGVGQLGTGVKMNSVIRMVDDYVNRQIRQENGSLQKFITKSDVLEQLEIIFNEPSDTGLSFNIEEMFVAWQELSKNPESINSKTIVAEKSKTLADTFNHMMNQIDNLTEETIGQIEKDAFDFNSIIDQIRGLNDQIFNISVKGHIPNDLLDQRDMMLKNLSSIMNFDTKFDSYGRVSISVDGETILNEKTELELSVIKDIKENEDGTFTLLVSKGGDSLTEPYVISGIENIEDFTIGQPVFNRIGEDLNLDNLIASNIKSGKIDGNLESLEEIADRKEGLLAFGEGLAEAINKAHEYTDIFIFEDGKLRINEEIHKDPSLIVAGENPSSPPGDGSRALEIASLRNEKGIIGGTSIEGAYNDIVTKVGISRQHAKNMVENQEVLMSQLEQRRESTSGVSIDEEVTNLIKFQTAYDANARVISVLSEMLDVLINRTGV